MSPSKPRVLAVGYPEDATAKLEEMSAYIEFVHILQAPREESKLIVKEAIQKHGSFEAVVFFTKWGQPNMFPLSEDNCGPLCDAGVRLFTGGGAGYDRVDTKYLASRQCYYANGPTAVSMRTADSTAMMILMALRGTSHQEAHLRAGKWLDRSLLIKDARTSTLGIVGMGSIGKKVAQHLSYFGMKVIYTKRTPYTDDKETGFTFVTQDELLAQSDVVCLMCPLSPETRGLIGPIEIAKMKDNVIIVNTSRGPVVNEQALVDGLESGKVLRAALDVFEQEPIVHPGLIASSKTTLLPHCAALNSTLRLDAELEMLANLESFIKKGTPVTPVNSW